MIDQKSISLLGWAEMGALSLIWGASFLANRVATEEAAVATTVAIRVLGAAAVLWAVVLARGLTVPRPGRIWVAFLLMGVFNNAIPFSLIVWGQQTIESGLAAILNASTAIMGVLVAATVFRDERLTPRKLGGVALGFLGVIVVMGPGALQSLDVTSLAQIAILGASLSYALSGALGRRASREVEPLVAAAGMLTGSSLLMVPAALLIDGMPSGAWSLPTWAALVYLSVGCSAVAYLIFFRLLRRVGAGNTSLVTLMIAPVAVLLGAVTYGEALPLRAFLGFGVLALGLAILDGRIMRPRAAPSERLAQ